MLVLQATMPVLPTTMPCPSQGKMARRDTASDPQGGDQKRELARATRQRQTAP